MSKKAPKQLHDDLTDLELAEIWMGESDPPPANPDPEATKLWMPSLDPEQMRVFNDVTQNTLVFGPRYTGKGWGCGYRAVRHCWDHYNVLVLVVVKTKRQGSTGGFFSKLGADILPDFERNLEGFSFKGPFTTQEKDIVYTTTNRYGGTSIIQMMSVLHDVDLVKKVKGIEASMVYIDEVTLFDSDDIFTYLRGTLGRRNHIPSEDQVLLASCNPAGPSHWVYKKWFVEPFEDSPEGSPLFTTIELRPEHNPDPKVGAYYDNLKMTLRNKPTEYARDIEGKWVDLPEGDAIFKDCYVKDFHVKGNLKDGTGITPTTTQPIVIGYDIGDTNHGVSFLQERVTKDKILWVCFDEVSFVGKKIPLEALTDLVMKRMQFWGDYCSHDFSFSHVSDKSAFDRFRSQTGSYDHLEVERHSANLLSRYPRVKKPIKLIECPKPSGSVSSRTRILMDMLSRGEFFVSANCVSTIETLEKITAKKDDPFAPNEHSRYKHMLDATTYPLFYIKTGGRIDSGIDVARIRPELTQFA